jgi:hypothetical protein
VFEQIQPAAPGSWAEVRDRHSGSLSHNRNLAKPVYSLKSRACCQRPAHPLPEGGHFFALKLNQPLVHSCRPKSLVGQPLILPRKRCLSPLPPRFPGGVNRYLAPMLPKRTRNNSDVPNRLPHNPLRLSRHVLPKIQRGRNNGNIYPPPKHQRGPTQQTHSGIEGRNPSIDRIGENSLAETIACNWRVDGPGDYERAGVSAGSERSPAAQFLLLNPRRRAVK